MPDQDIPPHPIPDQEMPLQPIPLQPVPLQPIPDQPMPLQVVPDHDVPDHEMPLHPIPDQPMPSNTPPVQAVSAASDALYVAGAQGVPMMSCSPESTVPSGLSTLTVPRARSIEPSPVEAGKVWAATGVAFQMALERLISPAPCACPSACGRGEADDVSSD